MKKKLIISQALMLLFSMGAYAVPANPTPFQKQQPDGSSHTVRLVGDEYFHYFVDEAGRPMSEGSDGWLYLLDTDDDGNLVQSEIKAFSNQGNARSLQLDTKKIDKAINLKWKEEKSKHFKGSRQYAAPADGLSTRAVPILPRESSFPNEGDQYGIAILVEFPDVKFKSATARDDFWRQLNEEGYADYDATGSARDFYIANSGGKFRPTWDVYGPVTVSRESSYYGQNMGGQASDMYPEQMIIEACRLVDNEVDFTKYDRDNDGYIDNVYVFYAGYGENEMGTSTLIWPHSSDVEKRLGETYKFDGKILDHYACNNELNGGYYMTGVGTFIHEFGHVLGLPDLYNLETSLAFTPNYWDAMDYGGPNNNLGRTPPNFSAVERYLMGWIEPRELSDPANITLDIISTNDAMIMNTDAENEFYLFENRQQSGWDAYIPGHGMLVWHLDFVSNRFLNGGFVNSDPDHMLVDLIEADGHPYLSSNSTDAFPGDDGRYNEISDATRVKLVSWSGNWHAKPITDIREEFGIIYFRYDGGVDEISETVAEASEISDTSFKLSWSNNYHGCYYTVSVMTADDNGNQDFVEEYEKKPVGYKSEFVVTGLNPSTTYYCYVTPSDYGFGLTGNDSNTVTVTTKSAEEGGVDSITGSGDSKLKVTKANSVITVEGISGDYLAVYRADGTLEKRLESKERVSFTLPARGLYIISDGKNNIKIIN